MEEFLRRASQQMEHAINAGYKLERIGFSMWAERADKIPFTVEFEFDYSGVNENADAGGAGGSQAPDRGVMAEEPEANS